MQKKLYNVDAVMDLPVGVLCIDKRARQCLNIDKQIEKKGNKRQHSNALPLQQILQWHSGH